MIPAAPRTHRLFITIKCIFDFGVTSIPKQQPGAHELNAPHFRKSENWSDACESQKDVKMEDKFRIEKVRWCCAARFRREKREGHISG